jgi:histidyl-tRNA synthetase
MVMIQDEQMRPLAIQQADKLRKRGIPADVYPYVKNYGKQIKYADKLGIPYCLFPSEDGTNLSIKDIQTGEQEDFNIDLWYPSEKPAIIVAKQ